MRAETRILIFTDWFAPAFKAGGPIQSCVNFARHMKDTFPIYVFTSNHDLKMEEHLEGIVENQWVKIYDGLNVFYASSDFTNWKTIKALIEEVNPAYLYLNSMFSRYFTIYPLLMKWRGTVSGKIVLAPRGMLRSTALNFKPVKKGIFLSFFKAFKIFQGITFQATDLEEMNNIKRIFGKEVTVFNIPNFPGFQSPFIPPPRKMAGELKVIFVGRIHPIKNLHLLLESLRTINGRVILTVLGMREDPTYWEKCQKIVFSLPDNIVVNFLDNLPHDKVIGILLEHHLFALPTEGENFGHAIFEALSAGRPALISDQTPWRNLEKKKAGWDLSLNDMTVFAKKIDDAAFMTEVELNTWCKGAWTYCNDYINQSSIKEQYLKLFN